MTETAPTPIRGELVTCRVKARDVPERLAVALYPELGDDEKEYEGMESPVLGLIMCVTREQVGILFRPNIFFIVPGEAWVDIKDLKHAGPIENGGSAKNEWQTSGPYRHPRFGNIEQGSAPITAAPAVKKPESKPQEVKPLELTLLDISI